MDFASHQYGREKIKITGPLCRVPAWKTGRLSDLIRSGLGREDLWAFDGNPDLVNRAEVTYYRSKENEPAGKQKAHAVKTGFGDVRETLVIDRDSETVEYVRKIGTGYQAVNRYYVRKKIRDFLDILDSNFLTEMIEEPPDAIEDRRTIPEYWIRVFTKKGRTHRTDGFIKRPGEENRILRSAMSYLKAGGAPTATSLTATITVRGILSSSPQDRTTTRPWPVSCP